MIKTTIQTDLSILITRGALDPEFCYPAGSGSSRIRIQTSTTADNRRKITLSVPLLEKLE